MHSLKFLLLGLCLAVPASAWEGTASLYGGGAFTTNDDAIISMPGFSSAPKTRFEDSGVVGARIGVWGPDEFRFLGGAFDVSGFSPDGRGSTDPADFDVVPISFLVMGRVPLLVSEEHPRGLLYPYVGVGPSIVVSKLEIPLPGSDFNDTEVDAGVDVRAGLALFPIDPFGMFLEYRFTDFEAEYSDRAGVNNLPASASPELATHYVQAGLSVRF
jgi:hypothetical protein